MRNSVVVDDEVMIRNVVRIMLEKVGYFILAAHDGEEALHISRKFPGTIHAVLSDVKMPKMDGLELRERMLAFKSCLCRDTWMHRPVTFHSSQSRSVQPSC
jgi:CheY-like chemotaxis protein